MNTELAQIDLRLDPNLWGYYRFEGNANADVGGINGTATDVSYGTNYGKFGQGASFNGTSSYISLGDHFDLTGDFTISAWVKTSATDGRRSIITKGVASHYQWEFVREPTSGYLAFRLFQAGGVEYCYILGTVTVADGKWHHVVATYKSSSPTLKIYVDGVLDGTKTTTAGTYNANDTADCRIGSRQTSGNYWNGYIDDLAIFSRELNATEVKKLYDDMSKFFLMF